jgi:predicted transcriptional regulator
MVMIHTIGVTMRNMVRTSLLLPGDLRMRLAEAAQRLGRSRTEVVIEALDVYLRKRPPPLSCIGVGDDKELSGAQLERWLSRVR